VLLTNEKHEQNVGIYKRNMCIYNITKNTTNINKSAILLSPLCTRQIINLQKSALCFLQTRHHCESS